MNNLDTSRQAISALTGIRFMAALAVYLFHYGAGFSERVGAPAPIVNILKNGYFGVSIFFILSGFILYYTYQNTVSSVDSYREFISARLARIYPVYILVLLFALPVTSRPTDIEAIFRVLSMTQSWTLPESDLGFAWVTQAWTLSIELFFYLIFPLLAALVARIGRAFSIFSLVIICAFILLGNLPTITPSTSAESVPVWVSETPLPLNRAAEFAYGILLCRLHLSNSFTSRNNFSSNWLGFALVAIIIFTLAFSRQRIAVAFASVVGGLLILQLASGASFISSFLSTRLMGLMGGASYSMYLLQGPINDYIKALNIGSMAPLVQLFACLGGSILLYKFYEEPIRIFIKGKVSRKSV